VTAASSQRFRRGHPDLGDGVIKGVGQTSHGGTPAAPSHRDHGEESPLRLGVFPQLPEIAQILFAGNNPFQSEAPQGWSRAVGKGQELQCVICGQTRPERRGDGRVQRLGLVVEEGEQRECRLRRYFAGQQNGRRTVFRSVAWSREQPGHHGGVTEERFDLRESAGCGWRRRHAGLDPLA
jgi:hypothetical protein